MGEDGASRPTTRARPIWRGAVRSRLLTFPRRATRDPPRASKHCVQSSGAAAAAGRTDLASFTLFTRPRRTFRLIQWYRPSAQASRPRAPASRYRMVLTPRRRGRRDGPLQAVWTTDDASAKWNGCPSPACDGDDAWCMVNSILTSPRLPAARRRRHQARRARSSRARARARMVYKARRRRPRAAASGEDPERRVQGPRPVGMIQSGGPGLSERRVGLQTQRVRLHQGPLCFRRGGAGRLGQALRVAQGVGHIIQTLAGRLDGPRERRVRRAALLGQ